MAHDRPRRGAFVDAPRWSRSFQDDDALTEVEHSAVAGWRGRLWTTPARRLSVASWVKRVCLLSHS
jgi:hypothetical protein